MPSTHLSLHYHIVFSTKHREALIRADWMERLHAYLGGCVKTLEAVPEEIGGVEDHVHLLIGLKATHCLADVVRDIKRESSKWVHEKIGLTEFAWQEGYGAFTVSPTQRPGVCNYIRNQVEHHHGRTFKEEYVDLLTQAESEYKPEFLW